MHCRSSMQERRVWRLCHEPDDAAIAGEAACREGSRWTSPGRPVVCLCTERGGAVLEILVHVKRTAAPSGYHAVDVTIRDTLWSAAESVSEAELPPDWREPGHRACRDVGDAWLSRPGHAALLMVPSAVASGVTNVLFDPRHADAAQVTVASIAPFVFDARLFDRG